LLPNTFGVIQRRKKIILFKQGKLWVFKHFFDNKETFKALGENYNEDKFRFELKTFGARNQALKILDRAGFDYELVEDLRPFVVEAIQVEQILTPAQELDIIHGKYSS
jgi:hypothetical protein